MLPACQCGPSTTYGLRCGLAPLTCFPPPHHSANMAAHLGLTTPGGQSVTMVSIKYFFDTLLPPLHPAMDIRRTVNKLKRMGTKSRRPITKHNRWWGFNIDPVERTAVIDATSFKHMADVARDIVRAGAVHGQEPSLSFHNNPQPMFYRGRDDVSLPDAYLVLTSVPETRSTWEQIAVSGEYDVGRWHEKENVVKIFESMRKIMREDPCRRFTFGFTIENTEMKLWYCDRSQTVASQPFNFITDHETLVHFFLSLAYASPVQLGWDPTIVTQEHGLQYRITVRSADGTENVYRTLEVLSDSSASVMHGPGTRVWKAVKVVDEQDHGDPVVLKDCWASSNRQREGTIHEKFRDADSSDAFREAFENSFLTVEQHGDVRINSQQPDRTPIVLSPKEMESKGYKIPPASAASNPFMASILWKEKPYTNSGPERKVHYRIVFKEICKSIKHVTSLQEVFRALSEACSALKLMYQTGWVHRDVSTGNILIDSHGKARLSDLEFAKDTNDQSDPELCVGTANFVAAEVQSQDYEFRLGTGFSPLSEFRRLTSDEFRKLLSNLESATGPYPSDSSSYRAIPQPPFPFRYNPLHDLESLWWIAVYFIFTTEVKNYANMDEKGKARQRRLDEHVLKLFCNFTHRKLDMMDSWNERFSTRCQSLHPSIRPIGEDLERARILLATTYRQCEKKYRTITLEPLEGLHDNIQKLFLSISQEIGKLPILAHVLPATNSRPECRLTPVQWSSSSSNNGGKRSRSDSTDDNGFPVASTSPNGKRARIEPEQVESDLPRAGMQTRSKARVQTNNGRQ